MCHGAPPSWPHLNLMSFKDPPFNTTIVEVRASTNNIFGEWKVMHKHSVHNKDAMKNSYLSILWLEMRLDWVEKEALFFFFCLFY